jgi:hypothetical protein
MTIDGVNELILVLADESLLNGAILKLCLKILWLHMLIFDARIQKKTKEA